MTKICTFEKGELHSLQCGIANSYFLSQNKCEQVKNATNI